MIDPNIEFSYKLGPWMLFLFIPAIAVALLPYFRLAKKYRRTRNRIASLVIHLLVMFLTISALSGVILTYKIPYYENELLLLVDVSHSNKNAIDGKAMTEEEYEKSVEGRKNTFIKSILDENDSTFKVGIITFAKEPYYAVKMSNNSKRVYDEYLAYLAAPPPLDDSATNVEIALSFAKEKGFEDPRAGKKIILITDGLETDGTAMLAVMSLASEDIKVDAVCFDEELGNEIQVTAIELPDYNIEVGRSVKIGVRLKSTIEGSVKITLYDNDQPDAQVSERVIAGTQLILLDHTFLVPAHHYLYVTIECEDGDDTVLHNNIYYAYAFLDVYDKVLIIDKNNESQELFALINGNYSFPVETMDISDVPDNLNDLSQYDQIILMNISNEDMILSAPSGFIELLHSYVSDLGGGLLTIGGRKLGKEEANMYGREDMNPEGIPSLYQEMLPVHCIDYYPPLALMLVIDRSGSMSEADTQTGRTKIEIARDAAKRCVSTLSERDYIGIVSFSDNATLVAPLTPATQKSELERKINTVLTGGGTEYAKGLDLACVALKAIQNVETKHIIMITDGEPTDSAIANQGTRGYNYYIDQCVQNEISISVIAVTSVAMSFQTAQTVARRGGGNAYDVKASGIYDAIKEELGTSKIVTYVPKPFYPVIKDHTPAVDGIVDADIPVLNGFYGVKAKDGVAIPLMGQYTPIYAQWKYGEGKVGSFMCDLRGGSDPRESWAIDFMKDDTGQQIVNNIIKGLFPAKSVKLKDIKPIIERENYRAQLRVSTAMAEGDTIEITLTDKTTGNLPSPPLKPPVDTSSEMPKCTLTFLQPGIYEVSIQKYDSNGNPKGKPEDVYTIFSYSAEYDMFIDPEVSVRFLTEITSKGGGMVISEPLDALRDMQRTSDEFIDPRIGFFIAAAILFLLDIAVRKFKFKWPWEILRDQKIKKTFKERTRSQG